MFEFKYTLTQSYTPTGDGEKAQYDIQTQITVMQYTLKNHNLRVTAVNVPKKTRDAIIFNMSQQFIYSRPGMTTLSVMGVEILEAKDDHFSFIVEVAHD